MKKRNTMAPEYQTRKFHFSAVWVMELSISLCLGKTKVFRIIKAWHCVKSPNSELLLSEFFLDFPAFVLPISLYSPY